MNRKSLIKLVRKFLRGEASPEERRFLEEYDRRFDDKKTTLTHSGNEAELEAELFGRINAQISSQKNRPISLHRSLIRYSVAASVVFLLGMALYTNRLYLRDWAGVTPERISVYVKPGQTQMVTLSDGTQVSINAGSTLTYPARFGSDTRSVTLDGEAYFDVAHDAEKPFLVSTSHLTVQVLGTRFNVSSYAHNTENQVAVVSGKVSVATRTGASSAVVLFPQQQAIYQVATHTLAAEPVDTADILSWQRDQLVFRNQRMIEVARALERKYDIHLNIDKAIQECRIYAKIGSGSSEKTLKAIATLLNARLETEGGVTSIKGKGCS